MKKIKKIFIVPLLWLLTSTILLTLPGSALPKEDWLDKIWFDKWVHIAMFSIMVFLWCRAVAKMNLSVEKLKKIFWGLTILWITYGVGMEFVQKYFISNRSFDLGDIAADIVGCVAGFIYCFRRFIKK